MGCNQSNPKNNNIDSNNGILQESNQESNADSNTGLTRRESMQSKSSSVPGALPEFSNLHGTSTRSVASVAPRNNSINQVATTRFLELKTIDYTDQNGVERKWDMASRTTKGSGDIADAVIIIPLLRTSGSNKTETLLVEQYRPPVGRDTIEFPAGLIDKDEDPETAAMRELREETGFIGSKCTILSGPSVSRVLCMSPGLCDETVNCVVVEVDMDNPANQGTPKTELDEGEFCVVKKVELKKGLKRALDNGQTMPFAGLYMFAMGLEVGLRMREK